MTWRQLQQKIINLPSEQLDKPIAIFIDHLPFSLPVADFIPKSDPAVPCLVSHDSEWSTIAQDTMSLRRLCAEAANSLEKYGINTVLASRIRDTLLSIKLEEWVGDPLIHEVNSDKETPNVSS